MLDPHVDAVVVENVSVVAWELDDFIIRFVVDEADAACAVRLDYQITNFILHTFQEVASCFKADCCHPRLVVDSFSPPPIIIHTLHC